MTLHEMIETADAGAVAIFNRNGAVQPLYHAIKRDGAHMLVPAPPTSKAAALTLMRALFELQDVVRYVFIDEAWMVGTDPAETERINREGVRAQPGRVEVLIYIAEDDTGLLMAMRKILRPAHGKATLAPLEHVGAQAFEGRMVGLLPRPAGRLQ